VDILVDGEAVANEGNTWNASVASGKHQVEFRHARFGTSKFAVDIKPGESKALTCYYEGYVSVAASPVWGIIVVNGKSTDTSTPRDRYPLPPGRHTISVMKNGYRMEGSPEVVTIEPSLSPKEFNLSFRLRKE
jgi:hypothetical protein